MEATLSTMSLSEDGSLEIPAEQLAALGLRPYSLVDVCVDVANGALTVRSVDPPEDEAWLYTPEHLERLRQADEDFRTGRYRQMSEADLRALAPCDD